MKKGEYYTYCSQAGIQNYYSKSEIQLNNINNCNLGIGLYNTSSVALTGNKNGNIFNTQMINDNSGYEVFTSYSSFPIPFKYNIISDPDNQGGQADALLYCIPPASGLFNPKADSNCWGNNFTPSQDLFCSTGCSITYLPTWQCPSGLKNTTHILEQEDENLFMEAIELENSGSYTEASEKFKQVIHQYPESLYATASLKELFITEEKSAGAFGVLREFYLNDDTIANYAVLLTMADGLANKCNEKIGSWDECIYWYENKILNSGNQEDSTYAVIDLGNLYLFMQAGGYKSQNTRNLQQYIPESREKYESNCDFLLSLLPPHIIKDDTIYDRKFCDSFLRCSPNPFTGSTNISYVLSTNSRVEFIINDQFGKTVKRINVGQKYKGTCSYELSCSDVETGMYVCTLIVNGLPVDRMKMIMIR